MFQVIAIAPPGLRGRFHAAAGHEPLCALAPAASRELEEILERVTEFADLPGWWQAALLRAEGARAGQPPPSGSCCAGP